MPKRTLRDAGGTFGFKANDKGELILFLGEGWSTDLIEGCVDSPSNWAIEFRVKPT